VVINASTASDSSSCNVSLALGLQIIPPSSTTSETTSCPCRSDTCDTSELCYVFPQARRNDGISRLECKLVCCFVGIHPSRLANTCRFSLFSMLSPRYSPGTNRMYATKFHVMTYRAIGLRLAEKMTSLSCLEQSRLNNLRVTLLFSHSRMMPMVPSQPTTLCSLGEKFTQCISSRPL
jgi:hypothetical protein